MSTIRRNICCRYTDLKLEGILEISEFYIETRTKTVNTITLQLEAPPKVFIPFLEYLCLRKLGHAFWRKQILLKLSSTIKYDNGHHIPDFLRSISWELLGICQQLEGDNREACHSYLMALRQEFSPYQRATCIRLCTILATYFQ